ncbi:hypothetical protein R1flu_023339 [Riccia fluitans]|uniref:Uncharacterized protein n=1 Tax=Riccia fluitans TaxID=41844 RepID=A0ABD1XRS0_9MARC
MAMSNGGETGGKRPGFGVFDDWGNIRPHHAVPMDLPVSRISCQEIWNKLSESQKHFIHHFSRASWSGSRICSSQISEESQSVRRLLLLVFSSNIYWYIGSQTKVPLGWDDPRGVGFLNSLCRMFYDK